MNTANTSGLSDIAASVGAAILLVEDEAIVAADISQTLQRMGHRVVGIVSNGREAVRTAERLKPDLALMDIELQGDMDGIEAATLLHARLGLPIVYLTGTSDPETLTRAIQSQPFGYVLKPFHEPEIRCAIEVALNRHRAQLVLEQRELALLQKALSLRDLSYIDELTGLYNRRGFLASCRHQLKAAERSQQSWLLLFMDLNGLKKVNDTQGHAAGDRMLQDLAAILVRTFRESDVVARLAGDEFVVLAFESEPSGGDAPLRRLRKHIREHNQGNRPSRALEVSVGVAIPDPARVEPIDDLIARADANMYEEKRRAARS